jgi:hypothetical protein
LGGRLPTFEEFLGLANDMGYKVPGDVFVPSFLPNLSGRWFWSSTLDPTNSSAALTFEGSNGQLDLGSHPLFARTGAVRCVAKSARYSHFSPSQIFMNFTHKIGAILEPH